jgi:WD40 repeat protein
LSGHEGSVNELAVLPQRGWLASVGQDGTLRFWDAASGVLVHTIRICDESLFSIAVSRDERYVAVGSTTAYLCDLSHGFKVRPLAQFEHTVESLAFSPAGDLVAAGTHYDEVRLIKLNGEVFRSIPFGARMESLEFQPGSSLLLAPNSALSKGQRDPVIELWDLDKGRPVQVFKNPAGESRISVSRYSPNGRLIAAGRRRRMNALVFDAATGRIVAETRPYRAWVTDVSFSPEGNQLGVGYRNGTVQIFSVLKRKDDYAIGEEVKTFSAHAGEVCCVRFLTDGTLATSGSDGLIHIWRSVTDKNNSIESNDGYSPAPRSFAWKTSPSMAPMSGLRLSPDGSRLLCLNEESSFIYDVASGELIERLPGPNKEWSAAAWSPVDDKIALGPPGKPVLEVIEQQTELPFNVSTDAEVDDVAFSPTDKLLAIIGHNSLHLASADDGRTVWKQSLNAPGHSVSFSPDGQQLAYGGNFQGVLLFEPGRRRVVRELQGGTHTGCVAFNPEGTLLAAGQGDGTVRVWDAKSGRMTLELKGHEDHVQEIAFSPDGRTLVSSSNDGTIRLWSVSLGCSYGVLHRADYSNCHFSFSADGRYFAAGWHDQFRRAEVLLWRLKD